MRGDSARRAIVLGIVGLAAAGVWVASSVVGTSSTPSPPSLPASAVLSGTAAHTSAWYCAAGAAAPSGSQLAVVLTNPGPRPVSGSLESASASGPGGAKGFTVPAGRQLVMSADLGAVSVLLKGGGVGVAEQLSGPQGGGSAPCTSGTDTSWYFAHGSTASGDGLHVALFNPLPTPAVVNMSFVSATSGTLVPPAYQGIPVAPGSVVTEDVSVHVPNDAALATEISALSGSVVSDEVDQHSGSGAPGSASLSIVPGVTAPSDRWAFAQNADPSGAGNVFSILNPSGSTATLTVSVVLAQGQVAPIVMHLAPHSNTSLTAQDQTRIPTGTLFGTVFSTDGPGIVVSRQSSWPSGAPFVETTAAQSGGTQHWLVASGSPGPAPWRLSIVDVAGHPVHVSVDQVIAGRAVALAGQNRTVLAPGNLDVVTTSPSTPAGSLPLEVAADGPVAVELDPEPSGIPGISTVPAWPLAVPGS